MVICEQLRPKEKALTSKPDAAVSARFRCATFRHKIDYSRGTERVSSTAARVFPWAFVARRVGLRRVMAGLLYNLDADYEADSMDREVETTLMAMGTALVSIQMTEKLLRVLLTYVFQKQRLTLESLERQQSAERRKTIGYFLAELRKRVDVEPSFDAVLSEFLDKRNAFVHDLAEVDGLNLQSPEGIAVAKRFVHLLLHLNDQVTSVTLGVLRAWQKQVGFEIPTPAGGEVLFNRIDEQVVPFVDDIFGQKVGS